MEQKTQNTALLVMDMQAGIVGMLPDSAGLLSNLAKAIAHARDTGIPVIYVVVGFRQGMPEVSYKNKSFFMFKERLASADMAAFSAVHADLAPAAGEVTVVKRRVSAFTGSDLEVILRAYDVQHIVLTGIATSGVVLSTLREAADKDYSISVIADCCADRDEEVHKILTTKVFINQSEVLSLAEWCK
jgi:nicotinamidase-related amidase